MSRYRTVITVAAIALAVIATANILYGIAGILGHTYYHWRCDKCGAELLYRPGRDLAVLTVRQAYEHADHSWNGERYRPWKWLDRAIRDIRPNDTLRKAAVSSDCTYEGLLSVRRWESEPLANRAEAVLSASNPRSINAHEQCP